MTRDITIEPGDTATIERENQENVEIHVKEDEEFNTELEKLFTEALKAGKHVSVDDYKFDESAHKSWDSSLLEVRPTSKRTTYSGFGGELLKRGLVISSITQEKFFLCRASRYGKKVVDK